METRSIEHLCYMTVRSSASPASLPRRLPQQPRVTSTWELRRGGAEGTDRIKVIPDQNKGVIFLSGRLVLWGE